MGENKKQGGKLVAQRLECPVCGKLLIKNTDLVIDAPVVMDLEKIKATNKQINTIVCHNCKRKLRYFVDC